MQYLMPAFIIASIVLAPYFIEQSWQVEEKMFFGKSTLKIPASIQTQEKTKFSIDFLYQKGPYTLTDLNATIDVYPQSAAPFVSVEITPLHTSLITTYSTTFSGKITVDNEIPVDQIFLSVYYTGKDARGTSYKSVWVDRSEPIKIDKVSTHAETCEDSLGSQKGQPIDLEYDIDGAKVVLICRSEYTNSVTAKIDAQSAGTLKIRIPKQVVYSLASGDCKSSDLLILMDKEEILPAGSIHTNKDNVITVAFSKGIHIIEFVGFTIMPDPAPYQYCGIVMGFDSQYLPPKLQIEREMKVEQVKCNEGLVLVTKTTDGFPACVKPVTKQKLIERGWATQTEFSVNSSGVPALDPKCNVMDELTLEVFHCPVIAAPTKMEILQVHGDFEICQKEHEDKSYILKPGETGKITYTVYRGMDGNNPPIEPEYKEILTEPSFLHESNTEQGRSRTPFTPDGVHVLYESDSSKLGFNQTVTVTVTVSVDPNVSEQAMWLGLPPFTCHGGAYVKFAILGE